MQASNIGGKSQDFHENHPTEATWKPSETKKTT